MTRLVWFFAVMALFSSAAIAADAPAVPQWPDAVKQALAASGTNRTELIRALELTPPPSSDEMQFLVQNMPEVDWRAISSELLLTNLALADEAFTNAPWHERIPREIFLNEILPYCCVNETRDNWRPALHTLCEPLVADCRTPAEAAQRLNEKLFKLVNVRYSTARKKADQCPFETMSSGLASCTGLSILLIDACRSVGVPARFVGTPMWVNMRGNHSWVEIWDDGWHFLGADEPDVQGLDHGWFEHDASQALKDSHDHAIYAASFKKTGLSFPLDWASDIGWINAANVTDHYTQRNAVSAATVPVAQYCYAPQALKPLSPEKEGALRKALLEYFSASPKRQSRWKFSTRLEKTLFESEPAVRLVAWEAYRAAPIHDAQKQDFDAKQVRFARYLSPYTVKTVGVRPERGWPLFIAMHGGGGVEKAVNDSQWRIMQEYYRDHPEGGGYIYVALRAPNDTWNGFYDDYVYPLVKNLVGQFLLFGDVDPDKVFLMGYSHGGYGAFAIGPKEPDLFAAIHASAAAPTEGETTGKTLRNTVFACMVGENDTMYDRIGRDRKFRDSIQSFSGGRPGIYPVTVTIIPNHGHTGLPDRDIIPQMYPAIRTPAPRDLTWLMTDSVIHDFFWLRTAAPGKTQEIDATCQNNEVAVTTTTNVSSATVLLDGRLVDYTKLVVLTVNGHRQTLKVRPSLRTMCETMLRRGDPELAFSVEVPVVK
ncbi:MAG TPA: transglutaminase domain-containing protein [Verrucomicrobiae bacterium]|jgi:pimeloyl-ACP methyl ester carboxylesterase|nr:transglutaminase domain-containing protein [Verrucomicrobiae bacterium]